MACRRQAIPFGLVRGHTSGSFDACAERGGSQGSGGEGGGGEQKQAGNPGLKTSVMAEAARAEVVRAEAAKVEAARAEVVRVRAEARVKEEAGNSDGHWIHVAAVR